MQYPTAKILTKIQIRCKNWNKHGENGNFTTQMIVKKQESEKERKLTETSEVEA